MASGKATIDVTLRLPEVVVLKEECRLLAEKYRLLKGIRHEYEAIKKIREVPEGEEQE